MGLLSQAWGENWFLTIRTAYLEGSTARPDDWSCRMLMQMLGNANQGISIEDAINGWRVLWEGRTDFGQRRERGITKLPTTKELIPSGVATLNKVEKRGKKRGRPEEIPFRDEHQDELQIKMAPRASVNINARPQLSYASAGLVCRAEKSVMAYKG